MRFITCVVFLLVLLPSFLFGQPVASEFATIFKAANSCKCSNERKIALYSKAIAVADAGKMDSLDHFNYAEAFNRRGEARKQTGAWVAAASDFKRAYELRSGQLNLGFKFARALSESGELEAAAFEYEALISRIRQRSKVDTTVSTLSHSNWGVLLAKSFYNLGVIQLRLQRKAEACDNLKKALQLNYPPSEEAIRDFCD